MSVTLSGNHDEIDVETFMLRVNGVREIPILTEIGDQQTNEDMDFTIDISASDVDIATNDQTLVFSAVSSDSSLVVVTATTSDEGTSGILSFDVHDEQNVSAEITVTVIDVQGRAVDD